MECTLTRLECRFRSNWYSLILDWIKNWWSFDHQLSFSESILVFRFPQFLFLWVRIFDKMRQRAFFCGIYKWFMVYARGGFWWSVNIFLNQSSRIEENSKLIISCDSDNQRVRPVNNVTIIQPQIAWQAMWKWIYYYWQTDWQSVSNAEGWYEADHESTRRKT